MIEAIITARPWTDEVAIWFVQRDRDGGQVYRLDSSGGLLPGLGFGDRYERNGPIPSTPSLILHTDTLRRLLEAGAEHAAPTHETVLHLKDAMIVRDRMIGLVETLVKEKKVY